MSVKRRLFISNMLMLVLPIILIFLTIISFVLIYTGVTGMREANSIKYVDVFFDLVDDVDELVEKLKYREKVQDIEADIDLFNSRQKKFGVSLSLYSGSRLVYPTTNEGIPTKELVSSDQNFILISESHAIYRVETGGEYSLVLVDPSFTIFIRDKYQKRLYLGWLMVVVLIIVVLVTNRALTKFVYRSIMDPINILVQGVHQIRDGNLKYRINYKKQDEFAGVCSDFNDMAQRLSTMVNERQKDETNRRELIAGISHDLRTPLTSINAYLEGIEKGVASTPEKQRKYFEIIKSKTSNLEHLINQLFSFSKLDIGEFPFHLERINVGDEIRRMMGVFSAEYESRGLDIHLENHIRQAIVQIDVVQFRNVIQNILENSLKYKVMERAKVRMICSEEEDNIQLKLVDNGPGVSEDDLEKMFDVFYRGDVSRGKSDLGSGLGLAISKKIIEGLGGNIYAEHEP
ncbi:ATP-binding protein [Paenibacillus sp. JCM 10914]|uniref:HAMP domain-containing sensor histidine kinase n=1 Tax=Paenibacillus sp. JCM 10914 TaxID=1236974 RepID=UPI0003CC6F77|nr:ATP-binding protein [Paenibacillus sp. JCM 10914]GAE08725.1 sensor histidine kinase [Paenibacillus sp. JCM 10914]